MQARIFAIVVSVVLIGLVVSPIARNPLDDGFPLSTYPMFAQPRQTRQRIDYAFGETATGERRQLTPMLVGSREVLQAVALIARAVGQGKAGTEPLCARIAKAVGGDPDFADVAVVKIVTGTHDAIDYLVHDKPGVETLRARCLVPR